MIVPLNYVYLPFDKLTKYLTTKKEKKNERKKEEKNCLFLRNRNVTRIVHVHNSRFKFNVMEFRCNLKKKKNVSCCILWRYSHAEIPWLRVNKKKVLWTFSHTAHGIWKLRWNNVDLTNACFVVFTRRQMKVRSIFSFEVGLFFKY